MNLLLHVTANFLRNATVRIGVDPSVGGSYSKLRREYLEYKLREEAIRNSKITKL